MHDFLQFGQYIIMLEMTKSDVCLCALNRYFYSVVPVPNKNLVVMEARQK